MSKEKQTTKVRLLRGLHSEGGKTYEPGSVFQSTADVPRQNPPGFPPRFEILEPVECKDSNPGIPQPMLVGKAPASGGSGKG